MWWPFNRVYPETPAREIDTHSYDYVIVGGGTAGCVLASRLSEDPKTSVLLLERGAAQDTWASRVPLLSANTFDPSTGAVSWLSEPAKFCNDRQNNVLRGEVLGGTSRVNGLLYTRGAAADYNYWASLGYPEWSYDKVLPFFMKSEKSLTHNRSESRGTSGPWTNQGIPYRSWTWKAFHVFQQCAEAVGFPLIADANSAEAACDGLALVDTITDAEKKRTSTFDAFLPRETALKRQGNLKICTGVVVSKLQMSEEKSSTGAPRVKKVHFQSVKSVGKGFSANVNKEVIVCSGALGSPQVLMLSGIGPKAHLEELGLEVVHDLPGVGSSLADHVAMPLCWEVPMVESLVHLLISPLKGALEFLKYILFRTGLMSQNIQQMALLVRGKSLTNDKQDVIADIRQVPQRDCPEDSIPDIEIMPLSISGLDDYDQNQLYVKRKMGSFCLLAALLRPKSRGTVRLSSSNPSDRPKVDFGNFSNPEDYIMARTAVRLALKLGQAMKDTGFPILSDISVPVVKDKDDGIASDESIDEYCRLRGRTTYHYSCTCRMSAESDGGVVDGELRVYGTANLRVCDASIFPHLLATHLQAPVVMVAEKCADMIKSSKEYSD